MYLQKPVFYNELFSITGVTSVRKKKNELVGCEFEILRQVCAHIYSLSITCAGVEYNYLFSIIFSIPAEISLCAFVLRVRMNNQFLYF
jgi:hypothetical protein